MASFFKHVVDYLITEGKTNSEVLLNVAMLFPSRLTTVFPMSKNMIFKNESGSNPSNDGVLTFFFVAYSLTFNSSLLVLIFDPQKRWK
jgi:hypothetical protein